MTNLPLNTVRRVDMVDLVDMSHSSMSNLYHHHILHYQYHMMAHNIVHQLAGTLWADIPEGMQDIHLK